MWILVTFCILISNSLSEKCDGVNDLDITNGEHLESGDILYKGKKYGSSEYSFDNGVVKACFCKTGVCILKCCPPGYGYEPQKKKCLEVTEPFGPPVIDEYSEERLNASEYFHFNFGKPTCIDEEVRIRVRQVYLERVELRKTGNLFIEVNEQIPPWVLYGPDKYCVDTFIFEDDSGNRKTRFDALVCSAEDEEREHYIISATCMLISCVFILATVAVYGWLPELRNLHGRVLMAYLLCLFVAFACLSTMQLLLKFYHINIDLCVGLSIIIYFCLLAAFFWLNVMCFDIWWTFSGKRGITIEKKSVRAQFCAYSIYAFGLPLAFTILLVSLEFSGLKGHPLLPHLRDQGCFISGRSKLLYLYGPIVILWCSNMLFFLLTAVKIAQIKKQISVLKHSESTNHDGQKKEQQRKELLLYIKLFIVMGLNWVLEVISSIYPEAEDIFRFIDAYNLLIGLIIFIIFVCKRKIFKIMKKRYKQIRGDSLSKSLDSTKEEIALTSRNQ